MKLLLAFGSLDVSSYSYSLCIVPMQIHQNTSYGSQRHGNFHGTSMSNTRACPFLLNPLTGTLQ